MLDRPDRQAPRFPAVLEETVRAEIEACVERQDVRIGYSSLACGGDMLFVETVLNRGGEVHIFLPFDVETFIDRLLRFMQSRVPSARHRVARKLRGGMRASIISANTANS